MTSDALIAAASELSASVETMRFAPPVTHVYNPLTYASAIHERYLRRYGEGKKRVIFLGMNPGPFGMAQIGVPFGEISLARDWLKLEGAVGKPLHVNPQRPVEGFACARSEVSGRRLWGLFRERFSTPEAFFAEHFVANYCPLAFFAGGRNLTPDKLPGEEQAPLLAACDAHLCALVATLEPEWVIGVGAWAETRARAALEAAGARALSVQVHTPSLTHRGGGCPEGAGEGASFCPSPPSTCRIARILHPSPASPAANRGWAEAATRQLTELGVWPSF